MFLCIPLEAEPGAGKDLSKLRQTIAEGYEGNVGLALFKVDVLSCESICKLFSLKGILSQRRRKLILYGATYPTLLGQFTVLGIREIFQIVKTLEEAKRLMEE
ncbi:MAG: hypothetical protein Q8N69_02465 [bacterium]|nr:hypothetical protein [bacterium]